MRLVSPVKWAGSKIKERKKIEQIIGQRKYRIAEPFMGTGIITGLFGKENSCLVNDLNYDIINLYDWCEDDTFIKRSREMFTVDKFADKDYFYNTRAEFNELEPNTLERAIKFFFLQNCAHFGLYRLNKHGHYTSTWHFFTKNPKFNERLNTLQTIKRNSKQICRLDYKDFIASINPSDIDLMFIDPPYIESAYDDYSVGEGFNHSDLKSLDEYCGKLLGHNVKSIMCNYQTHNDAEIYKNATSIIDFTSNRSMSMRSVSKKRNSIYVIYGDFTPNQNDLREFI